MDQNTQQGVVHRETPKECLARISRAQPAAKLQQRLARERERNELQRVFQQYCLVNGIDVQRELAAIPPYQEPNEHVEGKPHLQKCAVAREESRIIQARAAVMKRHFDNFNEAMKCGFGQQGPLLSPGVYSQPVSAQLAPDLPYQVGPPQSQFQDFQQIVQLFDGGHIPQANAQLAPGLPYQVGPPQSQFQDFQQPVLPLDGGYFPQASAQLAPGLPYQVGPPQGYVQDLFQLPAQPLAGQFLQQPVCTGADFNSWPPVHAQAPEHGINGAGVFEPAASYSGVPPASATAPNGFDNTVGIYPDGPWPSFDEVCRVAEQAQGLNGAGISEPAAVYDGILPASATAPHGSDNVAGSSSDSFPPLEETIVAMNQARDLDFAAFLHEDYIQDPNGAGPSSRLPPPGSDDAAHIPRDVTPFHEGGPCASDRVKLQPLADWCANQPVPRRDPT